MCFTSYHMALGFWQRRDQLSCHFQCWRLERCSNCLEFGVGGDLALTYKPEACPMLYSNYGLWFVAIHPAACFVTEAVNLVALRRKTRLRALSLRMTRACYMWVCINFVFCLPGAKPPISREARSQFQITACSCSTAAAARMQVQLHVHQAPDSVILLCHSSPIQ